MVRGFHKTFKFDDGLRLSSFLYFKLSKSIDKMKSLYREEGTTVTLYGRDYYLFAKYGIV